MTTIASPQEFVHRSAPMRLRELVDDLAAVRSDDPTEVAGWMSRPSILRRVASEFASRLAADTDRVIAFGPGSLVLGGAVSLATGLPFCAVERDGLVFGEHHAGENVALVSADGDAGEPDWTASLDVSRRLTVVAGASGRGGSEVLVSFRSPSAASELEGHNND